LQAGSWPFCLQTPKHIQPSTDYWSQRLSLFDQPVLCSVTHASTQSRADSTPTQHAYLRHCSRYKINTINNTVDNSFHNAIGLCNLPVSSPQSLASILHSPTYAVSIMKDQHVCWEVNSNRRCSERSSRRSTSERYSTAPTNQCKPEKRTAKVHLSELLKYNRCVITYEDLHPRRVLLTAAWEHLIGLHHQSLLMEAIDSSSMHALPMRLCKQHTHTYSLPFHARRV
jgi:hypothetical protein